MSIEDLGRMIECDHAEYRRIYDKHKDTLKVFSSYSGGIFGMPEMSTAWGLKGYETAIIASECENWERKREDPKAWTYWKNADLVAALDREADLLAALIQCCEEVAQFKRLAHGKTPYPPTKGMEMADAAINEARGGEDAIA